MKKNLRIASVAAAALLAVAPVAASAVPAHAGVSFGNGGSGSSTPSVNKNQIAVNVALGDIHNKTVNDILTSSNFKITATLNGTNLTVPALTNPTSQVKFYPVTSGGTLGTALGPSDHLDTNAGQYVISIQGLKINGLSTGTNYEASEGNFGDQTSVVGSAANTKNQRDASYFGGTTGGDFSEEFTVTNPSLTGTPYFYTGSGATKTVQTTGNVSVTPVSGKVSLNDVASAIHTKYKVDVSSTGSGTPATVSLSQDQIANDVKTALQTAGITLDSSNQFNTPANSFTVNVKATASNGKTVTLPVTVGFGASTGNINTDPYITVGSQHFFGTASSNIYTPTSSDSWAHVAVNGNVDTNAIKNAFHAIVHGSDATPTPTPDNTQLPVSVDTSKVNTKVAGTYPVTVSATNPAGHKSSVTFQLRVGEAGATYQTAKSKGTIYHINGNTATATSDSVKSGDNVATFGTVTAGGHTYVRINSADSNDFVLQSVFQGSKPVTPTKETSTSKKVMFKSVLYDKNGARISGTHAIGGYTNVDLATKNGKLVTVTNSNGTFYKIANKDQYIRTRNVDGSKATLKKNAYVYKSNGRKARRRALRKGTKITVYGGSYRAIRHYKGRAYRIGVNRYVKVGNVKSFKLA